MMKIFKVHYKITIIDWQQVSDVLLALDDLLDEFGEEMKQEEKVELYLPIIHIFFS